MTRRAILAGMAVIGLGMAASAEAADGNWRLGRVYYRMVCTACHTEGGGKAIPPSSRTKAEWNAYLAADKHDATGKADPKVSYYVSQAYRESVKDRNKAAAKFLKMPDGELMAAINAFVVYGAKDSDNPTSCQ